MARSSTQTQPRSKTSSTRANAPRRTGGSASTTTYAWSDQERSAGWPADSPEADALRKAADACNASFAYLTQEDAIDDVDLLACIVDCAELCTTTAAFIVRGSEHAGDLREVCADVAKCVEEACEEYADDEALTACADACREAYDALDRQSSPRVG